MKEVSSIKAITLAAIKDGGVLYTNASGVICEILESPDEKEIVCFAKGTNGVYDLFRYENVKSLKERINGDLNNPDSFQVERVVMQTKTSNKKFLSKTKKKVRAKIAKKSRRRNRK